MRQLGTRLVLNVVAAWHSGRAILWFGFRREAIVQVVVLRVQVEALVFLFFPEYSAHVSVLHNGL